MLDKAIYADRRKKLRELLNAGLILIPGNDDLPSSYGDNCYPFRQDSSFLYFFGIDSPNYVGLMDMEAGEDFLFGDEVTLEEMVWVGPKESVSELGSGVGIEKTGTLSQLRETLSNAIRSKRQVHYLPQYRPDTRLKVANLLELGPAEIDAGVSPQLIDAVVRLRSVKSDQEVEEIEKAVDIAQEMHLTAMRMANPGVLERHIAGTIEGIAIINGAGVSYRPIVSMDGQVLHNLTYENRLEKGRLMLVDAGAETVHHYCSDITRTFPIGSVFSQSQKAIYSIVLQANIGAIEAIRPGLANRDIHLLSAEIIAEGLIELGIMKGQAKDAVAAGAHALFYPHGVGHMLGLDTHDMEALGEDRVGYGDMEKRSGQFGLSALRLAKPLEKGFVVTIEPGIYFIPALIDQWRETNRFPEYINYQTVDAYRDFGGIRIEDNIVVTETGHRVLGKAIPKTINEIESVISGVA